MKRLTIAAVVVPCLLGAGLAYSLITRTASARKGVDDNGTSGLLELKDEVKKLKRELTSRRHEQAMQVLATAQQRNSEAFDDEDRAVAEPTDDTNRSASATKGPSFTEKEAAIRMESHFDNEPVDVAWRNEATPFLDRQFKAQAGPGSRITGIDCRQSLCRVEMVHKDFATYQTYSRNVVMSSDPPWRGGFMMHVVGDHEAPGELKAFAYMARPGVDIGTMVTEDP